MKFCKASKIIPHAKCACSCIKYTVIAYGPIVAEYLESTGHYKNKAGIALEVVPVRGALKVVQTTLPMQLPNISYLVKNLPASPGFPHDCCRYCCRTMFDSYQTPGSHEVA